MMAAEKSNSKGQAWFCTTGLPSDIVVEVDDMTFHLHKFPLMSKSQLLHHLITEQETNTTTATVQTVSESSPSNKLKQEAENGDSDDGGAAAAGGGQNEEIQSEIQQEGHCHIPLPDFPGGSETFETAAKFCYGVKIDLSASNAAPLRCAGEVLQMTEEYSEDNLISKTEKFLSQYIFRNLKDSIKALKSCEGVMPLAESLGIVQRCIDAIASKAASIDPSVFGWPVNDVVAGEIRNKTTPSKSKGGGGGGAGGEPWFEDLYILSLDFFKRLIFTMRDQELNSEIIESCLIHYANKCFPGITRSNRKPSSSPIASEAGQREVLETIIMNLPLGKSPRTSTATRLLCGLLRTANILNASEACKAVLERKIGAQLEQATLDDLLIPSYSYLNETLYDVDCIQRILAYFLDSHELRSTEGAECAGCVRSTAIMLVGKLIDGYLSEIASDANLKPERFYELAISLPEQARLYYDGLYRAVDVYLKAHPWISEADKENICGAIDCQKLTLEACTHAAQNERLPLRAVVQVLFFEQLQLRHAVAGTLLATEATPLDSRRPSVLIDGEEGAGGATPTPATHDSSTWRAAMRENQVLRLDIDSMRTRVHELERECSTMKKVIEKFDKMGPEAGGRAGGGGGWRSTLTRKLGCKFKTQVCDSHEQTVVESRKARNQSNHHRT
ncbi:hypothetical protein Ancab_003725 [Ancistrocladus abbreviatus]